MSQKEILIVSRSFYPVKSPRSFRTTELVKEFSRQGHKVTLLTPKKDNIHVPFEKEHGIEIKDIGKQKLNRLDISGDRKSVALLKRIANRALNLLFEYPDIQWMWKVKKALKHESGYDLMISIAAPHPVHWGVALARNQEHSIARIWVADCGDPFMGATLDTFNKLFYFKYLEKFFCKKADYISVPIEGAKEGYYSEFWEKIKVIPQGFNFNEVEINKNDYEKNSIPKFAYAGGLIPGSRDPTLFLEHLTSLEEEYKFIIYTRDNSLVEPFLKKGEDRIEVRGYIPRKDLLQVLSKMDFLINLEYDTSIQRASKLIDYYLTGRPVMSVWNNYVDEKVLQEFFEGNYENRYQFEDMDKYKIENICKKFLSLLSEKNYE